MTESEIKRIYDEWFQTYITKMGNYIGEIICFTLVDGSELLATVKVVMPAGFVVEYPAKLLRIAIPADDQPTGATFRSVLTPYINRYTVEAEFVLSNSQIIMHGICAKDMASYYKEEFVGELKKNIQLHIESLKEEENIGDNNEMDATIQELKKQGRIIDFTQSHKKN